MMRDRRIRYRRSRRATARGFTLIEALIAIVLMSVILAGLASITSQWLPNWNRGVARVQRSELVSIALDRLIADIGAAEFVSPNRDIKAPIFDGTEFSLTLVRSSMGPSASPGLEIVRIAQVNDKGRLLLVRSTKPFAPLAASATFLRQEDFTNPVVLLRAPYQVSLAYAGSNGIWQKDWQNVPQLPTAVRLTVRDATSGQTLTISTTALVHVELPAACVGDSSKDDCPGRPGTSGDQPNNPTRATSDKQRT